MQILRGLLRALRGAGDETKAEESVEVGSMITYTTDTASLVVFDEQLLSHRLDDYDWWSLPHEELQEENAGNLFSVDLGSDGVYRIDLRDEALPDVTEVVSANLKCASGKLFVGPGECGIGDGMGPSTSRGGRFIVRLPGTYKITLSRLSEMELGIWFNPIDAEGTNDFSLPLQLE